MEEKTGSLLIGFDFSEGNDVGVVIVGKKRPNETVEIVNAFQGQEAIDIYNKLIAKK